MIAGCTRFQAGASDTTTSSEELEADEDETLNSVDAGLVEENDDVNIGDII